MQLHCAESCRLLMYDDEASLGLKTKLLSRNGCGALSMRATRSGMIHYRMHVES